MKKLLLALSALVLWCAPGAAQLLAQDSQVAPLVRATRADEESVRTFYDLRWSGARLDALDALAQQRLAELHDVAWNDQDVTARCDRTMLRYHLEDLRSQIALDRVRLDEMRPLLPYLELVEQLERDRSEMAQLDMPALAQAISAIPEQVRQVRSRIVKSGEEPGDDAIVVSATLALRAAAAGDDLLSKLNRWNEHYRDFVPDFAWWIDAPMKKAQQAMRGYHEYLRRDLAGQRGEPDDPLVGDPVGRERLSQELRREMIAYSPEELIAIGERELAWCQEELRKCSRQMGLGDDFAAAIEQVKQAHVPPGEQAGYITQQANEAIAFVSDLVTVPDLCAQLWRTQMIPTQDQRYWPFAAYGDAVVMVSYATEEMDTSDKMMAMRGNNRHFTRIVVPHELIPGHHLQRFMSDRERTYRQLFATPFYVEGWSLYWEFELWDRGYAKSPEDRVGMLFWRSHRAARIIVSLKYHLGEMTPDEMIDFLVDQVGHERANATSEVRRYVSDMYSPLYQVAYMIGGIQIRALRDEAVRRGWELRDFNDAVLREGPIPVEMVRADLLGMEVGPDFEPSWRFDDK